ncbi:MAG: DUF1996 domain-containing protein [Roseiflexaceae bacterium]|nr:DUF1996 domain-containing protein [Roseiflexaceae bacterium]
MAVLLVYVRGTAAATLTPDANAAHANHHPDAAKQNNESPLLTGPTHKTNDGPFFQVHCSLGQRLRDDPIVFPNQPGASHEHQFSGAKVINAFSSYETLTRGGTSCNNLNDTAGYWAPALYDSRGVLRSPFRIKAYYYANNSGTKTTLRAFPRNLRIIAGDPRATGPQPVGVIDWFCRNRTNQDKGLPLARTSPPQCDSDEFLSLSIRFPDCWDGVNLDSSDHRRHMAYSSERMLCPSTHPVKLPKLRLSVVYEDKAFTGGNFTLGGTSQQRGLPWYAMHADFWNTWQQSPLEKLVNDCLKSSANGTTRPSGCQS